MNQKLRDSLEVINNRNLSASSPALGRLTAHMPEHTDICRRIASARHIAGLNLADEVAELRAACAAVIEAEDGTEESEMDAAVTLCRAALR